MKTTSLKSFLATATMGVALAAVLAGCGATPATTADNQPAGSTGESSTVRTAGTLLLSVNPEIEIEYDDNGLVTKVEGVNDDGRGIVGGYTDYEGKECRVVVSDLVTEIYEAGHFNETVGGHDRNIVVKLQQGSEYPGEEFLDGIEGDVQLLKSVEMVDQNPIGKSTRSNPVTYIKAYDEIRKLFSDQPYAQHNGLGPAAFSFNVAGGRCEECQGEGVIKVSMQFMADVELVCEACGGKRFRDEVLEVKYRDRSIYDVLEMTVDDAIAFFGEEASNATCRRIVERLRPLQDVGLGYIKLGQSSSTLSGGESQRIKLASFLSKESTAGHVMFIFDEPTTGLHFHDISKLLAAFNALIEKGHTIVVVEHNMEIIKCADWVVDLGPEAGAGGGRIVFEGTPRELEQCAESHTGHFLRLHTKH